LLNEPVQHDEHLVVKGKVERGVGHAKNTPLKGQRFESLAEIVPQT